jgi:hypothetical protein
MFFIVLVTTPDMGVFLKTKTKKEHFWNNKERYLYI